MHRFPQALHQDTLVPGFGQPTLCQQLLQLPLQCEGAKGFILPCRMSCMLRAAHNRTTSQMPVHRHETLLFRGRTPWSISEAVSGMSSHPQRHAAPLPRAPLLLHRHPCLSRQLPLLWWLPGPPALKGAMSHEVSQAQQGGLAVSLYAWLVCTHSRSKRDCTHPGFGGHGLPQAVKQHRLGAQRVKPALCQLFLQVRLHVHVRKLMSPAIMCPWHKTSGISSSGASVCGPPDLWHSTHGSHAGQLVRDCCLTTAFA